MDHCNISHNGANSAREERSIQKMQKKQQGQKRHASPQPRTVKKQRVIDNTVMATDVLANAVGEEEAEIPSVTDRQDSLAMSTRNHYRRYQAHWINWCQRKKYPDDEVTHPKVLVYVQELVADETVLADDDYHSIKPIRVHATDTYEGDLPSPETIDAYIKAINDLYNQQQVAAGQSTSHEATFRRTNEVFNIIKNYKTRYHELKKNQNVSKLTSDSKYERKDLKQMLKANWTRNYRHQNSGTRTLKIIGARNRMSLSWKHFMTAHGASVRTALLSDLYPHQFAVRENGKQFAFCVALKIAQEKTNQDHELYSCFVRNKDVEICPVSCLAFYFLELWMSPQAVPDFKQHEWKREYLIHASSRTEPMAPTTLYRSLSADHRAPRVTQGDCNAREQHARTSGANMEDTARHGNWNHRRLVTHYLTKVPKEVPYKMTGFTHLNEEFWLDRNTVLPSKELQRMVFPFIEELFPGNQDWVKWIENIMEDNPEDLDRPHSSEVIYPEELIPAMRLMLVLAHLRKVILQDAVALYNITDDVLCLYSQHEVFRRLPVFSSTMFKEYYSLLRESMRNVRADSQTATTQAIHDELRSINTALEALDAYVRQRFDELGRNIEGIGRQVTSLSRAIDQLCGTMTLSVNVQQQVQPQAQELQPVLDEEEQKPGQEQEQEKEQQALLEPSSEDLAMLEDEIALTMAQIQPQNQGFEMKPRDSSLEDHFGEWFAGEPPERPSIWMMNNTFKKSWRKGWEGADRNHYAFKKRLIMEVLKNVHKAEGPTLEARVANGMSAVQEAVNCAGSISKHNKTLQQRRER